MRNSFIGRCSRATGVEHSSLFEILRHGDQKKMNDYEDVCLTIVTPMFFAVISVEKEVPTVFRI